MKRATCAFALVIIIDGIVCGAAPVSDRTLTPRSALARMMELNRAGKWEEAAALAVEFLAANRHAPQAPAERAEAYHSLVYARARLGRLVEARAALADFDRTCKQAARGTWVEREMDRLRSELEDRPVKVAPGDDGWEEAEPPSLGLSVSALEEHRRLCERSGADACLVVYRGKIVQEWYGDEYREPMNTMSSVKSWTGLLAGMLIAEGKIEGIDAPVSRFVPEWQAGAEAGVTLRHLLTMTSGLKKRLGREPGPDQSVGFATDKNPFVLSLPLAARPGVRWDYSNEGAQILSPILERAAGVPLEDYARTRLFEPLSMHHTRLRLDVAGNPWTYADAETTLRDFAKVGQLMLDGGRRKGRRIVPEKWVQASIQPIPQNPEYGLLWWLVPGGYAARGYLDTDCYVFPEQQLVIARMQGHPKEDAPERHTIEHVAKLVRSIAVAGK